VFISSLALASQSKEAPPLATPVSKTLPLARVLTISGGISLGAYEAGYNWAFIRYLKKSYDSSTKAYKAGSLAAVTGASAGNINAFLSAISWCQSVTIDSTETAEKNLFWDTWINVGWERLFPSDSTTCAQYTKEFKNVTVSQACGSPPQLSVFLPDDGLFTRRAFLDVQEEIASRVARGPSSFNPCSLPLGITVTKVIPSNLQLEKKLNIATQRFAVTVLAKQDAGGLGFYVDEIPEDGKRVGKYLSLPAKKDRRAMVARIPGGNFSLLDVIEASSAFPVAFGPKTLAFCEAGAGTPSNFCAEGKGLEHAQFIVSLRQACVI
jgi:hypothetical protein